MTKLVDICSIIRSKNSGPYELTLDIIFKSKEDFEMVCEKKIINTEIICNLYKIKKDLSNQIFFIYFAILIFNSFVCIK